MMQPDLLVLQQHVLTNTQGGAALIGSFRTNPASRLGMRFWSGSESKPRSSLLVNVGLWNHLHTSGTEAAAAGDNRHVSLMM